MIWRMQLPMDCEKTGDVKRDGDEQDAVIDELVPVPLNSPEANAHPYSPLAAFRPKAALAGIAPARKSMRSPAPTAAKASDGWIGACASWRTTGFQPAQEHVWPKCRRARQQKNPRAHRHGRSRR